MSVLAVEPTRAKPIPIRPRSLLWRNRRGACGVVLVGLLVAVGLGAPMLASNQPIICRHEGRLHMPAVKDALRNLPVVGRWFRQSKPFRFPGFDAKAELDPAAFAIWPPIRYGPLEMTAAALDPPSGAHWLGTDDRGRDVLSRLIRGTSVSVKVGLASMGMAGLIGVFIGAVAGYAGGRTDWILSRVIEVVICFPTFFLVLSVMVWLKPGIDNVIVVIGLTQWTAVARLTRAEFLRMRTADFVVAARCSGASRTRLVFRHMLPGAMAPVVVTLAFGVADAVMVEAGLSWLGFGVPTPDASWGNMLRGAYDQLRSATYLVYPPCVAIFVSVMAFHLVGDGLREALDPKSAAGAG
jgi:peptide/nickel transport system permease protein